VPPLRERRHDIPLLVCSFLYRLSNASGRQYRMSEEALQALLMYDWPGNVRELEGCVQHACSAAREPIIGLLDLPRSIRGTKETISISLPNVGVVPLHEIEKRSILEAMLQARGNKRLAAQLLGIGKTTLCKKLKDFGAEDRESK
jgi:DNA-binding NtrC family response regulator